MVVQQQLVGQFGQWIVVGEEGQFVFGGVMGGVGVQGGDVEVQVGSQFFQQFDFFGMKDVGFGGIDGQYF